MSDWPTLEDITSARDRELAGSALFQGISLTSICLRRTGARPEDPELLESLRGAVPGVRADDAAATEPWEFGEAHAATEASSAEVGHFDDVDRDIFVSASLRSNGGRPFSRFLFKREVPRIEVHVPWARVGERSVVLREASVRCCLTVYAGGVAALATSLLVAGSQTSSGLDRAATIYRGPRDEDRSEGLTGSQIVPFVAGYVGEGCAGTCGLACRMLGDGQVCAAIGAALGQPAGSSPERWRPDARSTVLWDVHVDGRPANALELAAALPYHLAGLLTLDTREDAHEAWAHRSRAQVKEGLGATVGVEGIFARVCDRHLLIVTDHEDRDDGRRLGDWGTLPAPTRALEYACYQDELVQREIEAVSLLETETANHMSAAQAPKTREAEKTRVLRDLLGHVMSANVEILSSIESHVRPHVFKFRLERDVLNAVFEGGNTESGHNGVLRRLSSLSTIAAEAHSVAANEQLHSQQHRLVEIQNTNLVSQLELNDMSAQTQESSRKLGWINVLMALTAGINLLAVIVAVRTQGTIAERAAQVVSEVWMALVVIVALALVLTVPAIAFSEIAPRLSRRLRKAVHALADSVLKKMGIDRHRKRLQVRRDHIRDSLRKAKIVAGLVDEFEDGMRLHAESEDVRDLVGRWEEDLHALETACDEIIDAIQQQEKVALKQRAGTRRAQATAGGAPASAAPSDGEQPSAKNPLP